MSHIENINMEYELYTIRKEVDLNKLSIYVTKYFDSSVVIKSALLHKLLDTLFTVKANSKHYKPILSKLNNYDYLIESVILYMIENWNRSVRFDNCLGNLLAAERIIQSNIITDNIRLATVKLHGANIIHIPNPTTEMISIALTEQNFVKWGSGYDNVVMLLFKDNNLLINKWVRYARNYNG